MTALAGMWRFDGRPDAAGMLCADARVARTVRSARRRAMVGWRHRARPAADAGAPGGQFRPSAAHGRRRPVCPRRRCPSRQSGRCDRDIAHPAEKARQSSDAAILLAAIERWEESCFEHLVGDYAFALWDAARRRLILARDPLGQRPLHYFHSNGFFAFASMPKGLHALAEVPYAPDEEQHCQVSGADAG